MNYYFEIPGECRGKMRPKSCSFAGHSRVYTPHQQIEYENWVRQCFINAYPKPIPIEGACVVSITYYLAIPKSVSKKKREEMLCCKILPTKKPDVDNAAKSVLDSISGRTPLAMKDDSQVVELTVKKFYNEEPYVSVTIKEIEND